MSELEASFLRQHRFGRGSLQINNQQSTFNNHQSRPLRGGGPKPGLLTGPSTAAPTSSATPNLEQGIPNSQGPIPLPISSLSDRDSTFLVGHSTFHPINPARTPPTRQPSPSQPLTFAYQKGTPPSRYTPPYLTFALLDGPSPSARVTYGIA